MLNLYVQARAQAQAALPAAAPPAQLGPFLQCLSETFSPAQRVALYNIRESGFANGGNRFANRQLLGGPELQLELQLRTKFRSIC